MSGSRLKNRKRLSTSAVSSVSRLAVLLIIIIMGCIIDSSFLSMRNISNNLANASILIVLGIGQTIAIITNGPDLSSGSVMTICGVIAAILMKSYDVNFVLAILLAVLVGCFLGALNGYMIAYVGLPSFISTYGLQWAVFGFAYVILKGYVLYDFDPTFRFIGNGSLFGFLQMTTVVMVVFVIFGTLLLKKTNFGRQCYAVGSNREAANMSGIDPQKVIMKAFILSGMLSGVTGILYVARMNTVQSDIGSAYLLPVLATVYMGGTSASGGEGGIWGTVVGALVMTMVTNCLNLLAVPSEWRDAIIGVLIIVTVLLDITVKKRMAKRKRVTV
ncbi:ABC transporter permease [Marasmitruncus massiliensis]|uniref:ABC transporter permease n=1 Tax=Marasmitruncus massiliensis TaxID=1944642 RepID=UPI000C7CF8A0|nr:ABC transporter permease [Marasmitruncus massiliensis]